MKPFKKQFAAATLLYLITPLIYADTPNPCGDPNAVSVFAHRSASASQQIVVQNTELSKTVSSPVISEGAIQNSRTCNDMVRDSMSSIFQGTPIGGVISLFGFDQAACDAYYDFTRDLESEYNVNIQDIIDGVNDTSSTQPVHVPPPTTTPPFNPGSTTFKQGNGPNFQPGGSLDAIF